MDLLRCGGLWETLLQCTQDSRSNNGTECWRGARSAKAKAGKGWCWKLRCGKDAGPRKLFLGNARHDDQHRYALVRVCAGSQSVGGDSSDFLSSQVRIRFQQIGVRQQSQDSSQKMHEGWPSDSNSMGSILRSPNRAQSNGSDDLQCKGSDEILSTNHGAQSSLLATENTSQKSGSREDEVSAAKVGVTVTSSACPLESHASSIKVHPSVALETPPGSPASPPSKHVKMFGNVLQTPVARPHFEGFHSNDSGFPSESKPLRVHLFPVPSKRKRNPVPGRGKENKTAEIVRKAVIDVLAHATDMVDALNRSTKALGGHCSLWDQMMKELEVRGARRQALQVFRYLQTQPDFKLCEQNFVTIISILGREGKLGLARETFDGMGEAGITPTPVSYTVLMTSYTKHGLLKEAWEVFELMKQKDCLPNVVTYNTLIHACAKKGFWLHKLVDLFEEMKAKGIQPDDITYNSMVNACIRCHLFDTASQIFKEMNTVNCLPNIVTYTALINTYGRAGKLKEALELFEEMKHLGRSPNSWTYNSLLKAYANQGCYEKVLGLYGEMEDAGCVRDLYTYNTVIDMFGRGGLFEEAEGVFMEMKIKGCTPDRVTYNTMLDAYSKGGQTRKAWEVLDNMKHAGCLPDLWTYNIQLDALGKAGSVEEAAQMFQALKDAGLSPNLVTYSAMVNIYGLWGLVDKVQKVWQEMREAGCVPNATAYCGLINSYSQHGMHQEALSTFQEMCKCGVEPDVQSYTALMDAYGHAGLCDEAERLLLQMGRAGFIADCVTYRVLVRAFAKADRFYDGLKYFEYIVEHPEVDSIASQKLIRQYKERYAYYTKYSKNRVQIC